jgi:tetratricopeptide (TPR) repeat protein
MYGVRFAALSFGLCLATLCTALPARADETPPVAARAPSPEARKQFERGLQLREEAKWVDAAQAFGKARTADDASWDAHLRYQEAGCLSGERTTLIAEYDGLLQSRPDDVNLKVHRLRLDPPAVRLDALTAALKAEPGRREFLIELGRAHLALGDVPAAKKVLESLWARSPDAGEVLGLSVEALRRSGDYAEARTRLESALKQSGELYEAILDLARVDMLEGKHEDAAKRVETVLAMRPSYVAAMLLRAEALSRTGKLEPARTLLDAAVRVNPEDPDVLLAVADLTAKGGKDDALKKSVDLYKKVLGMRNANLLRGWYGLGWAQERLNLLADAAQSYREASLISRDDAAIMNSIGVVFLKLKKFQDAELNFKKAIDVDRTAPEAYANMAAVAEQQADWAAAIKWYEKLLALKGQDKNVRALLNLAFDYEAISNYKKAEGLLERVRAIRPDDSEVAGYCGDNQFFQHKWKEAIKAYVEATKLDEKNRFAWRGLGLSHMQSGKPQEAVAPLEKAKTLKADDPATLLALGDAYSDNGDQRDLVRAKEAYEAYLKAGGKDGDVPAIIEQLAKEIESGKK